MSFKSLGDPFDAGSDLTHGPGCSCPICVFARQQAQANYECTETELTAKLEQAVFEGSGEPSATVMPVRSFHCLRMPAAMGAPPEKQWRTFSNFLLISGTSIRRV